ncbi:MAG: hypothetical protein AB7U82_34860 [Blastocatellales bacterium]
MTKKNPPQTQALARQVKKGEQVLETQAQSFHDGNALVQQAIQAAEFVGAANAVQQIAESLNAQAIQAWEIFQQDKLYEAYGCSTFVQFLERHPKLGLTKNKYYDRKQLLEAEGAETFDLLNSLQVPIKVRKQLTAGTIAIEGDDLIVGDKRAPISDQRQVKRLIAQIVEELDRSETKAAKTTKENEKLKKRLDEAKEEARVAGMHIPADGTDPANQAYMRVISALTELTRELNELPGDEADARLNQYRPHIAQAVEMCFAFSSSTAPTRKPDNNTGLTDEELADLMEE